jgi:peptide/nickel transport system permease protein
LAGVLLFVALFAPVLANDVPLCARVDGTWSFPAFQELVGRAPPGPDGSWKQWHAARAADSGDFAVFPLWSHGPFETDLDHMRAAPSWAHPLGTDDTGRDVLSRLLRGARTTIGTSLLGVLLAALIGTALGAAAGMRRGAVDALVLRLIEVFLCFPLLLLLLAVAACFGSSTWAVVVAFAAAMWSSFARIVRGQLLSLREREFVPVARHLGVDGWRLFVRHLLPQVRGPIGVTAAFCMAHAIVAESTLSFLGVGPGVQAGSWGGVLAQGKASAHLWVWHLWVFPGAAIVGAVVCCHALADRVGPAEAARP